MDESIINGAFEINLPRRKEYLHELWQKELFDEIIQFAKYAIKNQATDGTTYKYWLFASIMLLKKQESLNLFLKMQKLKPEYSWSTLELLVRNLSTEMKNANQRVFEQFALIDYICDYCIINDITKQRALCHKVISFNCKQDYGQAIEIFENFLHHQQIEFTHTYYYVFYAYYKIGEYEKALDYYKNLIYETDYNKTELKFHSRELYYIFGEYEVANDYYESRLECYKQLFPHPIKPITAPTTGKKLLVISEGGFGDIFMSCKYIARLQEFGCHLTFAVHPKMIRLAKEMDYVDEIIDLNTINIDEYDFVIYAFSLMKILNINIHNIPSPAVKLKNSLRGEILPPSPFGIKIGIQWKSGMNDHRSLPLAELFAILPTNATKYNFQFDCNDDEKQFLDGRDDCVNLNPKINDWYDTAHYLQQMDYIVTIDSGIANCASFMGLDEKLYVLLHKNVAAHWYCMKLDYAPQHPGAHRFIQHEYNNWAHPLAECRQALINKIHTDFHNA